MQTGKCHTQGYRVMDGTGPEPEHLQKGAHQTNGRACLALEALHRDHLGCWQAKGPQGLLLVPLIPVALD